jgi:CBS domain containing-hemolysin-like protein
LYGFAPPLLVLFGASVTTATLADDLASIALLVFAEILAVFGSAADVALARHSRSRLVALAEQQRKKLLRVERRLQHVPTYILTARLTRFLGQALLVVGIAYLAFRDALEFGLVDEGLPWGTIAWVLMLLFVVTFAINDVLVRLLTARRPNWALLASLPYLEALRWILAPLRMPLVLVVRLLFRINLDADAPSAREEILETVEEGEREGSFTAEEAGMIESIIEMDSSLVKNVLTPRADVIMLQADQTLEDAIQCVRGDGYSRVPVYDKDKDDVVGLLYAHDLLGQEHPEGEDPLRVRDLMRKPFFVPENKPLNDLLREMRARKVHLAIVLDEFNGTEGIVTIEDLLEEIVGEIEDEYDDVADAPMPSKRALAEGRLEIEGRMLLEDLNEHLGVELPIEEDFETLGGLVFNRLGKVPAPGDQVEAGDVVITVIEADERRAHKLRVEVRTPPRLPVADEPPTPSST